jgi:hypothetical protein
MSNLRWNRAAAICALTVLAGCAGGSGTSVVPATGAPAAAIVAPLKTPSLCKGQKTTKASATSNETLNAAGGAFCIPAFKGFGGTIYYPTASPAISINVISSITNYNHKMQPLGSGTILFYLQLATSGAVTFGPSAKAGGGLSSKTIKPGQAYTAFGQASIDGFPASLTPCYTVAKKGRSGGTIGGIGSLLKSQNIPAAASGYIEIYVGKQTTLKC